MTTTKKSHEIQPRKAYVRKLASGIRLEAAVSPCVFMYAGYPLQVQVTLILESGDSGGSAIVVDRTLNANTAVEADVHRLVASVQTAPCKRCSAPAFDPSTVETSRDGLCETCFLSDLQVEFAIEQEAELRRTAKRDMQMKANGMKYRVNASIHTDDDDDYQIEWYVAGRPTAAEIRRRLGNEGSVVLDDWELVRL